VSLLLIMKMRFQYYAALIDARRLDGPNLMWKRSEIRCRNCSAPLRAVVVTLAAAVSATAQAYDVNDKLSVELVLAGMVQCQILTREAGADDDCGGAMPVRPAISLRPTDNDEIYVKAASLP
jgi:hypothetical protein